MRAPRLAAALVAPLLVVAACGDDDRTVEATGGAEALARLQAAPDAVAEAGTARLAMTMTMTVEGEEIVIRADGAYADDRLMLTMDFAAMFEAIEGEVPAMPGMDEPMTYVLDGTTTYIKAPMLAMLTGTDGWLSVSPEDFGGDTDLLDLSMGTNDPTKILSALRGVSDEFERVGEETVRGVDTTRYRVVIDLDKAVEAMPEDARASYRQEMAELGITDMPLDVWIADDGLVYRLSLDLLEMAGDALSDEDMDGLEAGEMVFELYDYGADIDIELPDPSEVTPFVDVMGGAGAFGLDPTG